MPQLTPQENLAIAGELERLYVLQDKLLTKEKLAFVIEEIEKSNVPFPALIAGIRKLMSDDVKTLKFFTIIEAAKKFIEPVSYEKKDCRHCFSSGAVSMFDDDKYGFFLACICDNGLRFIGGKNALVKWNGEDKQYSKGRWLTLRFNTLAQNSILEMSA